MPFRGYSVVAGVVRNAPIQNANAARQHMVVLTALMPHGTVLPARFGVVFQSRGDLNDAIDKMHDTFLGDLQRFRGQIELGLLVTDRRSLPEQPLDIDQDLIIEERAGPGLRYIATKRAENRARLERDRVNAELAAKVCAPESPLAAMTTTQVWHARSASSLPTISAAFLLARSKVSAFQAALNELRREEPALELLCTGPWPPFSFINNGTPPFFERASHGESRSRMFS